MPVAVNAVNMDYLNALFYLRLWIIVLKYHCTHQLQAFIMDHTVSVVRCLVFSLYMPVAVYVENTTYLKYSVLSKVMDHCAQIPLYTPVATFYNGRYSASGGLSGVFLGCLQNGIKVCKVSI